jgi:hypothetical protein
MKHPRLTATLGISAAAVVFAIAGAGPASADHGGGGNGGGGISDVRTAGACSAGSTWKAKAKPDDGRIQLEIEIDSNRVGQTWAVGITDNGTAIFTGNRVTRAPSGSFSVELRTANRAGVDHFIGTARNAGTGEICTAKVQL